jgi:plastocyanin
MTEHEHRDESVLLTSPGRMTRGIIIVAVTLAIGAAVVVTQWENFFSQPPPVTRLQPTTPPPPPPVTAGVTTIKILAGSSVQGNPDYDPDDAQVPINHKVVWANQDTVPHTATSGTGPSDSAVGARFDTSIINGGESSAEIEIDGEAGETIPYFCFVHPYMTSQLTLVEAEEGAGAGGPSLTILQGSSVQGNPDYDPDPMTVTAGEVITVFNRDTVPHTVTSGTGPSDPEFGKAFDTSIMDGGSSATIDTTGLTPGAYDFFCLVHPYMTGKLQVAE